MSVWPKAVPASLSLPDSEAALVSVSIAVEPRHLESLLEALAQIAFPINPRIDHSTGPLTVVEFPAYENHLDEVRTTLRAFGFDPVSARVTSMLEAIHRHA